MQKKNQAIKIYQSSQRNTTQYIKITDRKPKKQPNRRLLRINLVLKVLMDRRADESCNLKRNLGFNLHGLINTKEQIALKSIKDAFEGESK